MTKRRAQNSGKTAKARGRPFPPGQSGNPGGRPKLPADLREAYRAVHPRAVARLTELIESKDPAVALRACVVVIERVEGRVPLGMKHEIGRSLEDLIRESLGRPPLDR